MFYWETGYKYDMTRHGFEFKEDEKEKDNKVVEELYNLYPEMRGKYG